MSPPISILDCAIRLSAYDRPCPLDYLTLRITSLMCAIDATSKDTDLPLFRIVKWRYIKWVSFTFFLRIKVAWGVRWAESSPLTATLKEFFVASYLHFWDTMMSCFLAFVALWYLHTWFNSLTELVDYIDFYYVLCSRLYACCWLAASIMSNSRCARQTAIRHTSPLVIRSVKTLRTLAWYAASNYRP